MKFFLLSAVILLGSCSQTKKMKATHIVTGVCEKKFKETKLSPGLIIWEKVSEGAGTGMSYLVTGLGYSTDFAVSFTGGVIAGVGLCSPFLAAETISKKSSEIAGECLGEVGLKAGQNLNPKLGPKAYKTTENWRCPNVDSIAFGLVKVADCYRDMGQTELARMQLQKITNSEVFEACLSKSARSKVEKKLSSFPGP